MAGFKGWLEVLRFHVSIAGLSIALVLTTMALPSLMLQCIEGGIHIGFPLPFYGGCNSAVNVPPFRVWIPAFLFVDLLIWYIVSWGVLVSLRDRRARAAR